ncbi:MAG: hypothetical protein ACRDJP_14455 [Actinomycetota bacterium]
MIRRASVVRGVVVLAVLGLLAGAMATSSGAAGTVTKKKAKKIATKIANNVSNTVSNNVFNQNIPNYASRVSSTLTENPTADLLATTSVTAPASGYLVVDGIAALDDSTSTNDTGSCLLELNGTLMNGSEYPWTLDDVESETEPCVTHSVQAVTAGTHTLDFYVSGLAGTSDIYDARVTAMYIPLGGTGIRP